MFRRTRLRADAAEDDHAAFELRARQLVLGEGGEHVAAGLKVDLELEGMPRRVWLRLIHGQSVQQDGDEFDRKAAGAGFASYLETDLRNRRLGLEGLGEEQIRRRVLRDAFRPENRLPERDSLEPPPQCLELPAAGSSSSRASCRRRSLPTPER